jgi:spore germination protein YaaH
VISIEQPFYLMLTYTTGTKVGLDGTADPGFPWVVRTTLTRPHRLVRPGLALLLALVTVLPAGLVVDDRTALATTAIRPRITGIAPLSKEVYGYLPYWRIDSGTVDRIKFELVSTIAIFGLGIKADGSLDTAWAGYKEYIGDDVAAITNAAHDKGVRVVPTFQLFDSGSLAKMRTFLASPAAQVRFIGQALDLMAARQADGANLDFEPMLNDDAPAYLVFVARFRAAMKARFPSATLVNATSAGAGTTLVSGLVPLVDRQMIMTYGYRWSGSTVTGAIAPLDNTARTVKVHIARILRSAPAATLILGVPYFGYDWPVTANVPNATVQSNKTTYGAVKSVTYASARGFLAAHPEVAWRYDALEGSGYYTYWDPVKLTWRQVYFEEARSLNDKYDYALTLGLAGVGIWTLDNDRGYLELWDLLRSKFYAPVHTVTVRASVTNVRKRSGVVEAIVHYGARNTGTVPERGTWRWTIRDSRGRIWRSGKGRTETIFPGKGIGHATRVRIALASRLPAGTYSVRVRFVRTGASVAIGLIG